VAIDINLERDGYAFSNYIFVQNIIGCCEEFVVIDLDNNEPCMKEEMKKAKNWKYQEILLVLYTRKKSTFKK
jgi:hypothetical protein